MIIDLKECIPVIIEKHPFYESINKKLMEQVNSLPFSNPDLSNPYTNVIADQYTLRDNDVGPTIKLIQNWIKELISINVVRKGVNLSRFIMWFSKYSDEKGQGTKNHDHLVASSFSAVYKGEAGWSFVGVQILAYLCVIVISICTCGIGALVALPVSTFYVQHSAYSKGMVS